MEHKPGSIIVASGDLTRYATFSRSLACLLYPVGSTIVWSTGSDIVSGFNAALDQRMGDWVWIMGDDHVFAPDLLLRLLDRNVDVVSPLVTGRRPPFAAFVFKYDDDAKESRIVPAVDLPTSGCHPYDGCSGAGMLIREHVLQALEPPYYEAGKIRFGELNEDTWLMTKIRKAGFQIYVDFDLRMGHQTPAVIWPALSPDGRWEVECDLLCRIPENSDTKCP